MKMPLSLEQALSCAINLVCPAIFTARSHGTVRICKGGHVKVKLNVEACEVECRRLCSWVLTYQLARVS